MKKLKRLELIANQKIFLCVKIANIKDIIIMFVLQIIIMKQEIFSSVLIQLVPYVNYCMKEVYND